jgi:hypothetical protein
VSDTEAGTIFKLMTPFARVVSAEKLNLPEKYRAPLSAQQKHIL